MDAVNETNGSDVCEFTTGKPIPTWLTVLDSLFLITVLCISLLLNVSFTIVVVVSKSLHHMEMVNNLILTVSNICYSIVANTSSFAAVTSGGWPFGKPFCYVAGATSLFLSLLRYTSLLAITADRFGSVMYPFHYPRIGAKLLVVTLILGGLCCILVPLGFLVNLTGCFNFDQATQACIFEMLCHEIWCKLYLIFLTFVIVFFGVVLPLVLNAIMLYKAKKHRRAIALNGSAETQHFSVNDAMRAVVTVALLFASVFLLTLPYASLETASLLFGVDKTNYLVSLLFNDVYTLIPVADALVVWRNREVKKCALSLCKRIFKATRTVLSRYFKCTPGL